MKIVMIGQKGIPAQGGGIETHVEMISVGLVKAGHEVYVFTRPNYSDKKLKNYKGVNLISLPSIGTKHLDAISHTFLACLNVIFRRDIDIVHFHGIGPSSLLWLIKIFRPDLPVIATFHCQDYFHGKWGGFARFYLKFGENICCRLANKTIAVSNGLKKYAEDKYKKNVFYIPNGVDIEKKTEAKIIKDNWGLKREGYILSTSRLVRHKGIHYLIEAYKQIKTDKKLVIAGGDAFTENYVKELRDLAGNNPNIIFTGNQFGQTIKELYSNAYAFVQASESEGMSMSLLEAMAYGLPVLVSDIPENLECIKEAGFVFSNRNVESLKAKLEDVINNKEQAKMVGEQVKARIINYYSQEVIVDELAKVYKTVLRKRR